MENWARPSSVWPGKVVVAVLAGREFVGAQRQPRHAEGDARRWAKQFGQQRAALRGVQLFRQQPRGRGAQRGAEAGHLLAARTAVDVDRQRRGRQRAGRLHAGRPGRERARQLSQRQVRLALQQAGLVAGGQPHCHGAGAGRSADGPACAGREALPGAAARGCAAGPAAAREAAAAAPGCWALAAKVAAPGTAAASLAAGRLAPDRPPAQPPRTSASRDASTKARAPGGAAARAMATALLRAMVLT